jgi:hypothetical protein
MAEVTAKRKVTFTSSSVTGHHLNARPRSTRDKTRNYNEVGKGPPRNRDEHDGQGTAK